MGTHNDKQEQSHHRFARLLELDEDPREEWQEEDLASMLKHQLSAPVELTLQDVSAELSEQLRTFCSSEGLLLKSFKDLLFHERPPVTLLRITKDFAKQSIRRPATALPRDIALALYYASIAAALCKQNERITSLSNEKLREGFKWVLSQAWMHKEVQELCRKALESLQKP